MIRVRVAWLTEWHTFIDLGSRIVELGLQGSAVRATTEDGRTWVICKWWRVLLAVGRRG